MVSAQDGLVGNWSPGIGDPSFVGWFTVFAYFATAWYCRAAARRISPAMAKLREAGRERRFWRVAAILFVILGINKQLDLQSLVTEIGRIAASDEGWYEARRSVQLVFILLVLLAGVVAAAGAFYLVRKANQGARVTALGTALVIAFVVVRAASFHHMDEFIDSEWLGLRANWMLELGGIAVAFLGAVMQKRSFERQRPSGSGPRVSG